jgi:hypothetical protein
MSGGGAAPIEQREDLNASDRGPAPSRLCDQSSAIERLDGQGGKGGTVEVDGVHEAIASNISTGDRAVRDMLLGFIGAPSRNNPNEIGKADESANSRGII